MIVQCEACQTRFRLADEKIKPGGTKVRCSRCKEVFTVTLPKPDPVEEAVDFDSSNMERVTDEVPAEKSPTSESLRTGYPESDEQVTPPAESRIDRNPETSEQRESSDLDFSTLTSEMGKDAGHDDELAEDFSFADTRQPGIDAHGEQEPASEDSIFSAGEIPYEEQAGEDATDFSAAFGETEEPDGPVEFAFGEDTEFESETAESTAIDFSKEEPIAPGEFTFDSDEEELFEQEKIGEFSFEDEGEDGTFSFDVVEKEAVPTAIQEDSEPGEFSFDDDTSFVEDSASAWDEETSDDETSFNFEEPEFDSFSSAEKSSVSTPEEEGLQFGEIDFPDDSNESDAAGFQRDDDFSKADMPLIKETEPFDQGQHNVPLPSRVHDGEQLPTTPPAKKSPLARILVLLVLLLVSLGGAAGFLYMQEGTLDRSTIVKYLPFLQEYLGEEPEDTPGDRIGITIAGGSYVNGQAGQMLVIQGAAVNNYPKTRSAITVKGVLLNSNGQPLLQQTVFCGNKLDEAALETMPFAAIEEAMNNQFGEGLSNMNVAAGATIPFTIVFRNLPADIANINVEVVDSKPGAN
ncbi:MAG: zinc-ribbon domain-containing protein [Desulfuromonadales bacterium]|nr:zinc-ribbon domain-containing protein [Desulfuromonadales bacterium]